MDAILKNQLRHVSLAVSFTSSTVNESDNQTDMSQSQPKDPLPRNREKKFSPYLVGVAGLSTWSRFCRTPAGLQTSETTDRKPGTFFPLRNREMKRFFTHRKCRGYP